MHFVTDNIHAGWREEVAEVGRNFNMAIAVVDIILL